MALITKYFFVILALTTIGCSSHLPAKVDKSTAFEFLLNNDSLVILKIDSLSTISDLFKQYCDSICNKRTEAENYCLRYSLNDKIFLLNSDNEEFINLEFCGFKCNSTVSDNFANDLVIKPHGKSLGVTQIIFSETNSSIIRKHFIKSVNEQRQPLFDISLPKNYKINNCDRIIGHIIEGYGLVVSDIGKAKFNKELSLITQDSFYKEIKQKYPLLIRFVMDNNDLYCK